jgi:hypothetical protein
MWGFEYSVGTLLCQLRITTNPSITVVGRAARSTDKEIGPEAANSTLPEEDLLSKTPVHISLEESSFSF